jgi:hypothetical protein
LTRTPEIKNKTNRLVFIPLSKDDERVASEFKALCNQDSITVHDLLLEGIMHIFKSHNWPPGNPQLTLVNYQVKQLSMGTCGYSGCKNRAVASGVYLPRNQEFKLCKLHFGVAKNAPKVWKFQTHAAKAMTELT